MVSLPDPRLTNPITDLNPVQVIPVMLVGAVMQGKKYEALFPLDIDIRMYC